MDGQSNCQLSCLEWYVACFIVGANGELSGAVRKRFGFAIQVWPLLTQIIDLLVLACEVGGAAFALELATGISMRVWAIPVAYLVTFYSSGAVEEEWEEKDLLANRIAAGVGMTFGSLISMAVVVVAAQVLLP